MPILAAERGAAHRKATPTSDYAARRCWVRLRAALRAATRRPRVPLVRTAFTAARRRLAAPRRRALRRACRPSAPREAALRPSRRKARATARERVRDGRRRRAARPRRKSRLARARTCLEARPRLGALSLTPARRALESPIAIACCGERAPCLPSRT